ncbi:unnamed protein product [marine sediment metagenome]|uniref:Apea-like HEPN domain-containing protein n=1 Tax=marine sediment metagenome TaxID=412755 RepID=X1DMX4_9ZZZZ
MEDLRYIKNENKFLDYSFDVLKKYFNNDRIVFDSFYNSINSKEKKNKFLKIASFYKFLVVDGKFIVESNKPNAYIDYLDHTYKYIAIFSLIEDLYTEEEYKDFYSWLRSKETGIKFPIEDKNMLDILHEKYLDTHGSTQKAVRFFELLDDETKKYTTDKLMIRKNGEIQPPLFVELAKLLYQIRNDFIHKAKLIAQFNVGTTIHTTQNKLIINSLDFETIKMIFGKGLLKFFGYQN